MVGTFDGQEGGLPSPESPAAQIQLPSPARHRACQELGEVDASLYTLRHAGASVGLATGARSTSEDKRRGRWAADKSVRLCLDSLGQAYGLEAAAKPDSSLLMPSLPFNECKP